MRFHVVTCTQNSQTAGVAHRVPNPNPPLRGVWLKAHGADGMIAQANEVMARVVHVIIRVRSALQLGFGLRLGLSRVTVAHNRNPR